MKDVLNKLREEDLSIQELYSKIDDIVDLIIETDDRLLSVSKRFKSYGTWVSVGFANKYYFGDELSILLERSMGAYITHDEDRCFNVSDFRDSIFNSIYDVI